MSQSNLVMTHNYAVSYRTCVLDHFIDGRTIGNVTSYSATTSQHQSKAHVYNADIIVDYVPSNTIFLAQWYLDLPTPQQVAVRVIALCGKHGTLARRIHDLRDAARRGLADAVTTNLQAVRAAHAEILQLCRTGGDAACSDPQERNLHMINLALDYKRRATAGVARAVRFAAHQLDRSTNTTKE